MSHNTLDAGIPVLTEIIPAPTAVALAPIAIGAELVAPRDPGDKDSQPEASIIEAAIAAESRTATARDEAEWERLEREVHERVLAQVLERVDLVLEQRVRDSLADVLQLAVERLAGEIREGLRHSIKDVVSGAVQQEIAKLQSLKK